ncbi:MAG: family 1 glycosylhydrolase [Candidatus Dojkabacteria bacterium]
MNKFPDQIQFGIATSSSQHGTPTEADFVFVEKLRQIIDNYSAEEALQMILNDSLSGEQSQTSLKEIGLNINAIRNIIAKYVEEGHLEEAIDIVRSIADLLVFGIDKEIVFYKYVELLKLFNFSILRFSLDWNKIVDEDNEPNSKEIYKYAKKVSLLIENGIEPIITFSHFETNGLDIHSPEFEKLFKKVSLEVLQNLIPLGVEYWIAFNEPAVHSGGINLGFWGKGTPNIAGLKKHFKTVKRLGELSKFFYKTAHDVGRESGVNVKVIANFNVSFFDTGKHPTPLDKLSAWIGDKVDKDTQLNAYRFEDGKYAFDIIALNPYQIYNFALTNRFFRKLIPRLLKDLTNGAYLYGEGEYLNEELDFNNLIPNTSNPDFEDFNETRVGSHGEILHPKSISIAIKLMIERYHLTHVALTEVGADIYNKDEFSTEDKVWYLRKVKEELEKLVEDGISIPFVLIWTLIRMWEILGPNGGGIGVWDFGILGEPLSRKDIQINLIKHLEMDEVSAAKLAENIEREGNTPIRIYREMIENLGEIFISSKINLENVVEALITNKGEENELVINILQLIELKEYYLKQEDSFSVRCIDGILTSQLEKFQNKSVAIEQ